METRYSRDWRYADDPEDDAIAWEEAVEAEAIHEEQDKYVALFEDGVVELQRKLGRNLLKRELDNLWKKSPKQADPDVLGMWNDLHPDGDPLADAGHYMDALMRQVEAAEADDQ